MFNFQKPKRSQNNSNDCIIQRTPSRNGGEKIRISGNCTPSQIAAVKELSRRKNIEVEENNSEAEY